MMTEKKFRQLVDYSLNSSELAPSSRFKVFTFDFMLKRIVDFSEEHTIARVKRIAQWKIKSTENIIKSLLKNN